MQTQTGYNIGSKGKKIVGEPNYEGIFDAIESNLMDLENEIRVDRRRKTRSTLEENEFSPQLHFIPIEKPSKGYSLCKRTFDITVSSLALLALSPLMLIIAVMIKITSRGPIFFSQDRVGKGGVTFKFYKFRTMVQNSEVLRESLEAMNEQDGPVFKIKNDPRITSVGRYLRKYSLDELPQLWNVVKGDMSIVGPRPPLPKEVLKYKIWQTRRLSTTPGLTCIWQVSGRNKITFEEWMRLDLKYIDNQSFILDFALILKTFGAVVSGTGS